MYIPTTLRGYLPLFALLLFFCTCVRGELQAQSPTEGQPIFNDDFERAELGDFWNGNNGWTIRNGQAYNGVDNDWTLLTTAQSFTDSTYVLETEVSNLVGGYQRAYYLLFGQQDESGEPGYVVRYDPLGGGALILGEATDNYLYPDELDKAIVNLSPTSSHRIRVARYKNGLIQVYVGNEAGFPSVPTLEAITTTYPTLSKVSWTTFTQTAGEEFFVEYLRADVPEIQKIEPEKPAGDDVVEQIVADSDNAYVLGRMTAGETFYTDRTYTLTDVPDFLEGARFIKTANNDKRRSDGGNDFLTAYLSQPAIAYVAFDPRASALPDWLRSWTKTDEIIGTNDPGSDYFEVYTNLVPVSIFGPSRYRLRLGAPAALPSLGVNMNYIVALVPYEFGTRYEAEDAFLSGVRPASNHAGFSGAGFADYINPSSDYIEWVIDVAATSPYNILARFANGSSAARNLELSIDGEVLGTESFTSTGSWNNWGTRKLGNSILLSAGRHLIRLTANGSSGPNVDYLQVTPTNVYSPNSASVPSRAFVQAARPISVSVSVFPNPAVNEITLELTGDFGAAEVRVLDLSGREVYRQMANTDRHRIAVSDWPAGTYFYQLASGEGVVSGKFVKGR